MMKIFQQQQNKSICKQIKPPRDKLDILQFH